MSDLDLVCTVYIHVSMVCCEITTRVSGGTQQLDQERLGVHVSVSATVGIVEILGQLVGAWAAQGSSKDMASSTVLELAGRQHCLAPWLPGRLAFLEASCLSIWLASLPPDWLARSLRHGLRTGHSVALFSCVVAAAAAVCG